MALLRELKELHHTYKTIQRYLAPDCLVVNGHYNNRIPGKLAPYEKEVIELRSQGMTYPAIHRIISKKGYKGSVASLRMFIQKEKIRNQEIYNYNNIRSGYEPKEYIQRKSLSQLIYKSINDIHTIEADQFEQVLKTYPVLAPLYGSIRRFYEIIYSKQDGMIDGWLKELGQVEIPELETYIKGKKKRQRCGKERN